MSVLYRTCCRTDRSIRARTGGLALLVLAATVAGGRAQYRINQDGRLLDANPQVGASRYNSYVRPVSPLVGGNPYATGNIGRGLSLRSFAPIGSPTAFRAPLGSSSLSNFIRDSVSVGEQTAPLGGLTPRLFFDPVWTAPSGSYLRGFYDAQPVYPWQVPRPQEAGIPAGTSPAARMSLYGSPPARRVELEQPPAGSFGYFGVPLTTELSSTIFGPEGLRLPGPLASTVLQPDSTYLPQPKEDQLNVGEPQVSARGLGGPLDLRIRPESPIESLPTAIDLLLREDSTQLLTERARPLLSPTGPTVGAPEARSRQEAAVAGLPAPEVPTLRDASMLPGHDVFTDMQLALALSASPQADWYAQMQEIARESPTLTMETQARASLAAEEFLTRVLNTPMRTFVGEGPAAVNDELRRAEAAMELGRYYDAARHYERARLFDPVNPLPLVGKGHALLASGDYVSAAFNLIRGLERFPELTRFQVDLTALMGGGEIVDIRRADLMKLLAGNEDPQLRFLLGYLEIHSDNRELGLQNLDRAAQQAPPGSLIRRYPDMIRGKGLLPPPKLPSADIPDSSGSESSLPSIDRSSRGKESE